jgi:tetratricopeptide (TPR) repeat protein
MLLVGLAIPAIGRGKDGSACEELCAREFREIATTADSYVGLLPRLRNHEESCRGTVIYEARLSMAYSLNYDYENARRVIEPFKGSPEYTRWVDLALVYREHYRGFGTKERTLDFEHALSSFVRRHADVPEAWETLGYVRLLLGSFGLATEALEKALVAPLDSPRVYRDLTICYAQQERYPEALDSANRGYRDGDWGRYPTFALYTAEALLAFGKFDLAGGILNEMLTKNPNLRSDKNVVEVARLLVEGRERAASGSAGSRGGASGHDAEPR